MESDFVACFFLKCVGLGVFRILFAWSEKLGGFLHLHDFVCLNDDFLHLVFFHNLMSLVVVEGFTCRPGIWIFIQDYSSGVIPKYLGPVAG